MMSAPPDPTRQTDGSDDRKCKACGKEISKHNVSELKDCENFNYHMEKRVD